MDFITVREFRTEPGKVWEKLEAEGELVVTKNGKPFALLTATQPNTLEEDLRSLRQTRLTRIIVEMQSRSAERGLDKMTVAEIDAEIAASRAERQERNARGR